MRLLLVEDDSELADGLRAALAQSGYTTDVAHNGLEALAACNGAVYQVVVLDLGLPDMDGVKLLGRMRSAGLNSPVLILTARDDLTDRVRGLDAGGDDYLAKPVAIAELEARIRALLRRGDPISTRISIGAIVFEAASRTVTVNGQPLDLTASELGLFELLLRRRGKIVDKKIIFDSLYSWDHDANLSMVEVFVSRLRRKLTSAEAGVGIRAFRGLGYRLEAQSS
jgi:DNA-binding response OmpR family regulator